MQVFSERLKELRKENNLTTTQLGEKIKVSHATISRWENGIMLPDIEDLYNICIYFNVTPNYLLGFEN